jgi:predicted DNA-binding transcriptional regulator AlpA
MPDAPRLLTTKDVADLLRISPRQVDRLRKAGRIPPGFKLNGLRRWRADDIRAWHDAGCPPVAVPSRA